MTEGVHLRDDRRSHPRGLSAKLYWGRCECGMSHVRRGDRRVCLGCERSSELDEVDRAILAGQYDRPATNPQPVFSGVYDR